MPAVPLLFLSHFQERRLLPNEPWLLLLAMFAVIVYKHYIGMALLEHVMQFMVLTSIVLFFDRLTAMILTVIRQASFTADDLSRLIETANAPIFGVGLDGRATD